MKILQLVTVGIACCGIVQGAEVKDGRVFLAELKTVIMQRDAKKLDQLTYSVGMSASDRAQVAEVNEQMLFQQTNIASIAFVPLSKSFQPTTVVQGKRIEFTHRPVGEVELKYKDDSNAQESVSLPYAIIKGSYFLVSSKTTDLHWSGPPDVNIGFMVIGAGQDKVKIRVKYNASGVDFDQVFADPSATFWGQYISEMMVTSEDERTDVTLTVMRGGKEIYKSGRLRGKGELKYKRS
jgi:hypothetical protein